MFLVGLDIVGDKLMEINVFSPGGLGSAQQFEKDQLLHARHRSHRTQSAIHAVLRPQLRQRRHVHALTGQHSTIARSSNDQIHRRRQLLFKKRHPEVGARPGTLMIADDAVPPKVRMISYNLDEVREREIDDIEELAGALDPKNVTWVDVQGFGDEDIGSQDRRNLLDPSAWRWKTSSTCRSGPRPSRTTGKSW